MAVKYTSNTGGIFWERTEDQNWRMLKQIGLEMFENCSVSQFFTKLWIFVVAIKK